MVTFILKYNSLVLLTGLGTGTRGVYVLAEWCINTITGDLVTKCIFSTKSTLRLTHTHVTRVVSVLPYLLLKTIRE